MRSDKPIPNALDLGLHHHRAGRLAEAEKVYRQILSQEPNHPGALHLLGVAASQVGRHETAVELIQKAIAINPNAEDFHSNLGLALAGLGRFDEAIAEFRRALAIRPNHPEALANMSDSFCAKGSLDLALDALQQSVALKPDFTEAHFKLGNILGQQGQVELAIASYRRAISLRPNFVECLNNLGTALRVAGQLDEAILILRRATIFRPDFYLVQINLGGALLVKGQFSEAISILRHVLHTHPESPDAWNHLGNAHYAIGQYSEAVAAHRRGVALRPNWAEAIINLGNALRLNDQFDEAVEAFRLALTMKPESTDALNSLGNTYKDIARLDEAMDCYKRVLEIQPHHIMADSNYVFSMRFHPAFDDARIFQEQRLWSHRQVDWLNLTIARHQNDRTEARKLRIGYLSPTFRFHCQSLFTMPLLMNHDREQCEIVCYADGGGFDGVTKLLQANAHEWRWTRSLNDQALAEQIRTDKIDILVDLTMHMAEGRPLVMARKPAPIQVAYLAYPGTTGLTAMDYRFTDPYLDPPGERDELYSEVSIRLPDSFWCYDPISSDRAVNPSIDPSPDPGPLPALKNGFITFGCLNNFTKLNDGVLKLWAGVLKSVANSRLLILAPDGSARKWLLTILSENGVESNRVEFVGRQSRAPYMQQYKRIDICLDTLPANGHTTSLDSYWMGVPVITLVGPTVEGRAGWSQLNNLKLTELAARDENGFVNIATEWANDLSRLGELRRTLRERMRNSPIMDAKLFARNVESAYRLMWHAWCRRSEQ